MSDDRFNLRSRVAMAIGEASMCWEPIPSGIFQSDAAVRIVDGLVADITPPPAPRAEMPKCVERILAILQGYNAHVSPEYWNGTVKPAIAAVRAHFAAPEKREEQAEKDRRLGEAMRWYLENAPSATSLITMNGRRQIMTWIVGNYREFDNADSLASAIIAEKEGQA